MQIISKPRGSSMTQTRSYAIIVGVNVGPRALPLRNAENDARDLYNLLTGPLGPVSPANARLLLGPRATRANLIATFAAAQRAGATHLFVCFSGHGARGAILLSDGLFEHKTLAQILGAIRAAKKVVVLDCCSAGSFIPYSAGVSRLGGIPDASWSRAFAYSIPGTRVLVASRDDELSSDGSGTNGTFTHHLCEGLQYLDGDIHDVKRSYISAAVALQHASKGVRVDTDGRQNPNGAGSLSDFPLAISQDRVVIGEAWIFDDDELHARVMSIGRLGVETHATVAFTNAGGTIIDKKNYRFRPKSNQYVTRVPLQAGYTILARDPHTAALLQRGRYVNLGVHLRVRDTRGRVLASAKWTLRVPPPRPHIVRVGFDPAPLARQPKPSTGLRLGLGLLTTAALVGVGVTIARAPKWDHGVERYRGRDGKFRTGRW